MHYLKKQICCPQFKSYDSINCDFHHFWTYRHYSSADHEGGGDQGSGPPLGFVLCRGLMGGRGGPTVVFTLLLSIFSLRSPVFYKHFTCIYVIQAQCSVWNGHPFSIFPLSKLWQESNFQSFAFRHFHIIISNTFTISNLPCHLCTLCRKGHAMPFPYPPPPENKLVCK